MTRIDRRLLFTSGAAAALLAASGLAPERAPRSGGRLRLAVPRDDGSLEAVMRGAVFDTMTEIAPDGTLRPELATAWRGSEDARRWQFDLRQGVTFHDGRPFGADAVVASLAAQDLPVSVARIEAKDAHRILIELAQANPHLPYLLADPALVISPDGDISQQIGTGTYMRGAFTEGRHFRGTRVAQHYKSGQAGWTDTIDVTVIPDSGVRAEALRDGFVDVAALPRPDGLRGHGTFTYHPSEAHMDLAAHQGVGVPRVIGARGPLDDGRIAERWWLV
ncbi:ABC transporter substrate-binding protein [Pontibaca salina]|uniref:Peptide ABC transporter substrate-binding protein n=1 Tax=Pontibaca salina TaxID=2795731 RepID=A0A934HSD9_9RHOB|nr:ABC transporter substrate-binding protein [Pontibaca salina]MBI6629348.1 peptide ABC transporter substrate-binding protein [Pontibaca salina]